MAALTRSRHRPCQTQAELDDLLIQRILGFESVNSFVILLFVLTVSVVLIVMAVLVVQCVQAADAEFVMDAMARSRALSFTKSTSDRISGLPSARSMLDPISPGSARRSMNRMKSAAAQRSKQQQHSDRQSAITELMDSKHDAPDCSASARQESVCSTSDTSNGPRISHPSDRQPRISHPADRQSRACETTVERI